ncbi:MAG: hypothetical protein ACXWLM_08120 [Myxococcales bacterium]
MRSIAPLLVLLTVGCAAHEAASSMNARVLERTSLNQAAPVPGAHLVLQCPDGFTQDLGATDSSGILRVSPSTAPALDCKLTVARTGFASQTTSVGDVCTARAANVCTALSVNALRRRNGSAGY